MSIDAVRIQRSYYEQTAASYDDSHAEREHVVALHLLAAYIEINEIKSVLDVGAGTGRAMRFLRARFPDLIIKGVEPVAALREIGHRLGVPEADLVDGDGAVLPFPDESFDLVCEFAVLHHVRRPGPVVAEMNRVAAKTVAVSDANFMGQGPLWLRLVKFALFHASLWPAADFLKTRGKGYTMSEGDGLAYSYTVFQDLPRLVRRWKDVRVISTAGGSDTGLFQRLTAAQLLIVATTGRGA